MEEWVAKYLAQAPELGDEALDMILDLYDVERASVTTPPDVDASRGVFEGLT
jgi:hypothetical protein